MSAGFESRSAHLLADMVRIELHLVEDLDPSAIEVTESNGHVSLAGRVASWADREGAVRAARRVPGVRTIDARGLSIKVGDGKAPRPGEIRQAAEAALRWHLGVPHGKVHAHVHEGTLVLEGFVARPCEREAAEEAVRPLEGVTKIDDRIQVREDKP